MSDVGDFVAPQLDEVSCSNNSETSDGERACLRRTGNEYSSAASIFEVDMSGMPLRNEWRLSTDTNGKIMLADDRPEDLSGKFMPPG